MLKLLVLVVVDSHQIQAVAVLVFGGHHGPPGSDYESQPVSVVALRSFPFHFLPRAPFQLASSDHRSTFHRACLSLRP